MEEQHRQQDAMLMGSIRRWEQRLCNVERDLRRDIDTAGTAVARMQERSEKFLHLAEVLEDAVSKALRSCKDVARLQAEVKRIASEVSSLSQEFAIDREGRR